MTLRLEPFIAAQDPEVAHALEREGQRQLDNVELIASENYVSRAVLEAVGSIATNKYAEGYPGRRYYGGCEHVDTLERLAIARAKTLFGAEHVNVQAHSGSQANMSVYVAALDAGDKILAMALDHGGHLTHGFRLNFSGKNFDVASYGVSREDERIDFDEVAKKAREHRPKLIITGASAYPREIDFARFAEIASEVGALLMADIAHIAGSVATGLHPSPIPYADFVTATTHKTLRGPRGGLIMCKEDWGKKIDSAVFPGVQGGPLMHVIAGKAVAFGEDLRPDYTAYMQQVHKNAQALADELLRLGYRLVSGGTDNHLLLVDLGARGITGLVAEKALDVAGITVNKNKIPFDTRSALETSGIRIGTPAMTTRGLKEEEMRRIARSIDRVLTNLNDSDVLASVRGETRELCQSFPIEECHPMNEKA